MKKEFISYDLALKLKEMGFDEECLGHYIGEEYFSIGSEQNADILSKLNKKEYINAPLYQQAFRFFREKYKLHSYIEGAYPWFRFYINSNDDRVEGFKHLIYEEAELECLKKLIEIVGELK